MKEKEVEVGRERETRRVNYSIFFLSRRVHYNEAGGCNAFP